MKRRAFTLLGLRGAAALAALSVAPSLLASPASPASKLIGAGTETFTYAADRMAWVYVQERTMFGKQYYVMDWSDVHPKEELEFHRANASVAFKRAARKHMAGVK